MLLIEEWPISVGVCQVLQTLEVKADPRCLVWQFLSNRVAGGRVGSWNLPFIAFFLRRVELLSSHSHFSYSQEFTTDLVRVPPKLLLSLLSWFQIQSRHFSRLLNVAPCSFRVATTGQTRRRDGRALDGLWINYNVKQGHLEGNKKSETQCSISIKTGNVLFKWHSAHCTLSIGIVLPLQNDNSRPEPCWCFLSHCFERGQLNLGKDTPAAAAAAALKGTPRRAGP